MPGNSRSPPPIIIPTHEETSSLAADSPWDGTPSSSIPSDVSGSRSAGRRVQWPEEQDLAEHVSIEMMNDGPDHRDGGAADASWDSDATYPPPAPASAEQESPSAPRTMKPFRLLAKAALEKSREEERAATAAEAPPPRNSDMAVFVDSTETDGLPSREEGKDSGENNSSKAAWGLVRNFTSQNALSRRRNAGFTSGNGEGGSPGEKRSSYLRVDEPSTEASPIRRGGSFLKTVREAMAAARSADDDEDLPPLPRTEGSLDASDMNMSGGGILSALIALQRQQAESSNATPNGSGGTSAVTTPNTSQFPSRRNSLGDDEDDDEDLEKAKWLAKQKGKPFSKLAGAFGATSSAQHTRVPSSPLLVRDTASDATDRTPQPEPALKKQHKSKLSGSIEQLKNYVESELAEVLERPTAARSGAGVIGGLLLGAGNLAGVAAPAATHLGPAVDHHGFHVSRYESTTTKAKAPPKQHSPENPFFARHERNRSAASTSNAPSADSSPGHSPPSTPGNNTSGEKRKKKPTFNLNLRDLTPLGITHSRLSSMDSPTKNHLGEYFGQHKEETQEERENREWEKEKRRRRKIKEKKKRDEVFITLHVAAILERQQFILKLVMLISFSDNATHTSDIKFLKQANGLDLGKLRLAYIVYYNVIHDVIGVTEASKQLDELMISKPKYNLWQHMIIGGLASAFIQPSAFYGSFIDCLMAIPLGAFLVLVQVVVSKNDLYSSLFEIVIAAVFSFIAAALGSTQYFCFSALASGSIVLILPGYIVLCGSLELANRSIISGSVRLVYSILYSLFLGFGLSIGGEVYQRATGLAVSSDYTCASRRLDAPWYQATIGPKWFILTIPCYLLMLSLRNGQPLYRRELPTMIAIGSAGYLANYFSGKAFVNRSDISSALGSLAVGVLGNIYGKFTRGSPFVVMVAGVLLQLPSGLSNGGLLQFTQDSSNSTTTSSGSTTYAAGFTTAESLIEVAIGLTVGLFVSTALVNTIFPGGRRRGNNLSSF
ncbi:hypothetical protein RQP46_010000 [Phenoliferia psychrophenolica]